MRLLGFVPQTTLSMEWNVSSPVFVAAAAHALMEPARRRQLGQRERSNPPTGDQGADISGQEIERRDAREFYQEANRLLASLILAMENKRVVRNT